RCEPVLPADGSARFDRSTMDHHCGDRPTWRTRMTHSALTGAGATVLALALAACTSTPQQAERGSPGANAPLATTSSVERAHANLAPASGSLVSGRLMLSPMAG